MPTKKRRPRQGNGPAPRAKAYYETADRLLRHGDNPTWKTIGRLHKVSPQAAHEGMRRWARKTGQPQIIFPPADAARASRSARRAEAAFRLRTEERISYNRIGVTLGCSGGWAAVMCARHCETHGIPVSRLDVVLVKQPAEANGGP